jgi:hypothetical protein
LEDKSVDLSNELRVALAKIEDFKTKEEQNRKELGADKNGEEEKLRQLKSNVKALE